MVQTWPGAMKPCTRFCGDTMRARIAGGTRTWETSMEKFLRHSRFACQAAMALGGAVVSKPIARKTTFLSGLARAILTASVEEYAMRTSAPWALARNKSDVEPGTRSMSP